MKTALIAAALVAAAGCNQSGPSDDMATHFEEQTVPVDNTGIKERDRDPMALTPLDQEENEIDRAITQRIREGVVKDETFSMMAKNIKIIAVNGVVTLRGPVKDEQEKKEIGAMAQIVANVTQVDNLLEVEPN